MARSTLSNLMARLRSMASAGDADYTRGTASFWDSDQLQLVLEENRIDVWAHLVAPSTTYESGTAVYKRYDIGLENLEETDGGTALFYLHDSSRAVIASAGYTVDYRRGVVTFTADQSGSQVYVNCRWYDLNGAAADIWEEKANYYASQFDFSTDNTSIKHSQQYVNAKAQAGRYRVMSEGGSRLSVMYRNDVEDEQQWAD